MPDSAWGVWDTARLLPLGRRVSTLLLSVLDGRGGVTGNIYIYI